MRCEAVVFIAVSYARRCAAIPGENGPAPRLGGGPGDAAISTTVHPGSGGGKGVPHLVPATTKVPLSSLGLQGDNAAVHRWLVGPFAIRANEGSRKEVQP